MLSGAIPAKAGIQGFQKLLDSRLRGSDISLLLLTLSAICLSLVTRHLSLHFTRPVNLIARLCKEFPDPVPHLHSRNAPFPFLHAQMKELHRPQEGGMAPREGRNREGLTSARMNLLRENTGRQCVLLHPPQELQTFLCFTPFNKIVRQPERRNEPGVSGHRVSGVIVRVVLVSSHTACFRRDPKPLLKDFHRGFNAWILDGI